LGIDLYLKLENLQHTNSFKARGALNKLLTLNDEQRKNGVIACSAGNHAQGVAYHANRLGIPATIVMPVGTPFNKVQKTEDFGAKVVLHGKDFDSSIGETMRLAEENNYTFVHPFDDDNVIAGYSTAGEEVAAELDQIDVLLCSIGGGGIISGMSKAVKHFNGAARVYGVETYGAHSMRLSMEAGSPTTINEITSAAKSLGIKTPPQKTFNYVRQNISGLAMVSDKDAQEARRMFWNERQEVIELAASCNLAALENGLIPDIEGKNVVVLMCGGTDSRDNLDKEFLQVNIAEPFYALGQ